MHASTHNMLKDCFKATTCTTAHSTTNAESRHQLENFAYSKMTIPRTVSEAWPWADGSRLPPLWSPPLTVGKVDR